MTAPASPAARRPATPATSSSAPRPSSAAATTPTPSGDAGHDPSVADGEDVFNVYFLQSMNVAASPGGLTQNGVRRRTRAQPRRPGRQRLLLVCTTGSHGNVRNYVVDVLDTGAPNDGQDELAIYGIDNLAPGFNGYVAGYDDQQADRRHLPAALDDLHRQPEPVRHHLGRRPGHLLLAHRDRGPSVLRGAARRQQQQRRRPRPLPRPGPGQRAEQPGPEDQLRHRAQRPDQRLRHGRQRRLLRRRHLGDHDPRRRRRERRLPDRPDLRHPAERGRRRPARRGHLPRPRRDHARLAEPGHARTAAGHRWHRQRPVHRLLQPVRDPAQRRRPQRHLHRPGVRDRRGLRHQRRQQRRLQPRPTSTSSRPSAAAPSRSTSRTVWTTASA